MTFADFNGDGNVDIASIAIFSNASLGILLGNGDGTFSGPVEYGLNLTLLNVTSGDFNRDGKADLAVTDQNLNAAIIFLGNGDGTFTRGGTFAAGTYPETLTTGDFNRDGKLDIATGNSQSSNVSVLLGNGDGTFAAAVNYAVGTGAHSIVSTDLNRDGKPDLVAVGGSVAILLGNGDGTFTAGTSQNTSGTDVVANDFNGDGKTDLAVLNGSVSILLGNGDGTFATPVTYSVGATSFTSGDFNGDGKTDLANVNSNSGAVTFLLSNGDGTFTATANLQVDPTTTRFWWLASADFDRDGRADLVGDNGSTLSVLLNNSACSLQCSSLSTAANNSVGTLPYAIATGDFNLDHKTDLVVANVTSSDLSVLLGNGNGTFATAVSYPAGDGRSVVVADFNRDGKPDLISTNYSGASLSILLGNGDGTFRTATSRAGDTQPQALTTGDFNRDGKPDVAVTFSALNKVTVLLGNGDGTFATGSSYPTGSGPRSIVVADFNHDGKPDLATANVNANSVSILLGNGDGTFASAVSYAAGTNSYAVVAGDFNHDGKVDIAVANRTSSNVSVLLGNGDGTFAAAVNYAAGTQPTSITLADVNFDGKIDLVTANTGSSNVSVLLGNGDGTFATATNYAAGNGAYAVVAADFNGDGKSDVAVANQNANTVSILLDSCPAPDLALTKTHTGNFVQGQLDAKYTLTVTNSGLGAVSGPVTLTDTLPSGLIGAAMSGTGWSCTLATLTCTRGDSLASGASYPAVTLTVSVSPTAPAMLTNTATISGPDFNSANNSASDSTTIDPAADLSITEAHSGTWTQGQTGRILTIAVRNDGRAPTSGLVTVTQTLAAGLTATSIGGTGWSCALDTLTCTRSDSLTAGTNFPTISVAVTIAGNAGWSVTNVANVSGGGDTYTANDTATDVAVIQSAQNCGFFNTPAGYITKAFNPIAVAIADFNGDGKADVIVANRSVNGSILLGRGDGSFGAAATVLNGGGVSVVTADFNHDSKMDAAVVTSTNVSILLGNGNGTFAAAITYTGGGRSLVTGDFNGDGNADLAVADPTSNTVSILLGNGDGTFAAATQYATGAYSQAVTVGDFNGDGKVDLAVVNFASSDVSILLGNGDGTFATAVSYAAPGGASAIAAADFNGDGFADLAITEANSNVVSILLGNGDGTFAAATQYATGTYPQAVTVGDFDGDGKTDLVVANGGSHDFSILPGSGTGAFAAGRTYPASQSAYASSIALGDFNGDGRADLAFGFSSGAVIWVVLGGCPDLTITKTHSGNFTEGQSGAVYTLTVNNSGQVPSSGSVTVTDALPSGLTATAIAGTGWNCTLETLTCSRTDVLAAASAYPAITITTDVSTTAPANLTNTATVSGGSEPAFNGSNNTASDPTTIIQIADLTLTKTHVGSFAQGQVGSTYTITVTNSGGGASSGSVTVADTLPAGLTAISISGAGWDCSVGTVTCARNDALAPGSSYPSITVAVSVSTTAPANVVNTATVSGGGETRTSNSNASDPTTIIGTASNLVATAISNSQVSLTWSGVAAATKYRVSRSDNNGSFFVIALTLSPAFVDTDLVSGTTYVYEVRAADDTNIGPPSNRDIATTILFTDDPIIGATTGIKAVHIEELRTAVNAVRRAAGLGAAGFSDTLTAGATVIKASHLTELRANLDEARSRLGLPAISYTDPALTPGVTTIKAAHIRDLRNGVE